MSKTKHPSDARVRRAAHLERAAVLRDRKRLRRRRAEIHRAIESAKAIVTLHGPEDMRPYRALDRRGEHGWMYEDRAGRVFYGASRDKVRSEVRQFNEVEPPTIESALRTLGWAKVGADRVVEHDSNDGSKVLIQKSDPIEKKFVRVSA